MSKGLNFIPTCNNIGKAKHKMELEVFGRMLHLNRISVMKTKIFIATCLNPSLSLILVIGMHLEKLVKVEIPKDKFNNLTNSERKALYDLKMIKIL